MYCGSAVLECYFRPLRYNRMHVPEICPNSMLTFDGRESLTGKEVSDMHVWLTNLDRDYAVLHSELLSNRSRKLTRGTFELSIVPRVLCRGFDPTDSEYYVGRWKWGLIFNSDRPLLSIAISSMLYVFLLVKQVLSDARLQLPGKEKKKGRDRTGSSKDSCRLYNPSIGPADSPDGGGEVP